MKTKRDLTKGEIFLLFFVFIAICGLILYGKNNQNKEMRFTPPINKISTQK